MARFLRALRTMRPRHAVLLTPSIAASLPRVELRRPSPLPFNKQTAQNPIAHLSFFSTTCAMLILQVLSFDNDPSLMGGIGGVLNVSMFRPSNVHTMFRPIPCVFKLLRTLLHFFALTKISTLLFSSASALFGQNTGGWGIP